MTWSPVDAKALSGARQTLLSRPVDSDASEWLYARWYARPVGPVEAFGAWDPPVAGLLRAAHPSARSWSSRALRVVGTGVAGTSVVAVEPGRRAVCRGEYVTAAGTAGRPPVSGSRLRVLDRLGGHVADGWWRTWGTGWADTDTLADGVTRIYLAPRLPDVARLANAVVSAVAAVTDVWAVKVGVDASTLARGDGVVAYVPDTVARSAMGHVLAGAVDHVRTGRPPLTFELAPGISWAHDPGDGDSFGEQRCRALAAVDPGEDEAAFLRAAAEAFVQLGLDPWRPWQRAVAAG